MTTATLLDRSAAGEEAKRAALGLLELRRGAFVLLGRRAPLTALLRNGTATADDVRRAVELPADVDPACLGAVPGTLARAGIIARVGYAPTDRAEAHARPVTLWTLTDADAARRWLAANPERPDAERETPDAATSGGSANAKSDSRRGDDTVPTAGER